METEGEYAKFVAYHRLLGGRFAIVLWDTMTYTVEDQQDKNKKRVGWRKPDPQFAQPPPSGMLLSERQLAQFLVDDFQTYPREMKHIGRGRLTLPALRELAGLISVDVSGKKGKNSKDVLDMLKQIAPLKLQALAGAASSSGASSASGAAVGAVVGAAASGGAVGSGPSSALSGAAVGGAGAASGGAVRGAVGGAVGAAAGAAAAGGGGGDGGQDEDQRPFFRKRIVDLSQTNPPEPVSPPPEAQRWFEANLTGPLEVPGFYSSIETKMLLYGPPGCGKTALVKWYAKAAGCWLIEFAPKDIVSSFQGLTFRRIGDLFLVAEELKVEGKRVMIFGDEIDGLLMKDGGGQGAALNDRVRSTFLAEVEKPRNGDGVIYFVAATNFLDKIDPAAVRNGRIGTHIEVAYPDEAAITSILRNFLVENPTHEAEHGLDLEEGEVARIAALCMQQVHPLSAADVALGICGARKGETKGVIGRYLDNHKATLVEMLGGLHGVKQKMASEPNWLQSECRIPPGKMQKLVLAWLKSRAAKLGGSMQTVAEDTASWDAASEASAQPLPSTSDEASPVATACKSTRIVVCGSHFCVDRRSLTPAPRVAAEQPNAPEGGCRSSTALRNALLNDPVPQPPANNKSKGQYFTWNETLQRLVGELVQNKPTLILEPSFGRGDLVRAVALRCPTAAWDLYELDHTIDTLPFIKADPNRYHVHWGNMLALTAESTEQYETIVMNPPFLRGTGGKPNLYLQFLERCIFDLLKVGGECVFIVPQEFFRDCSDFITRASKIGSFTHRFDTGNSKMFEVEKRGEVRVVVGRFQRGVSVRTISVTYSLQEEYEGRLYAERDKPDESWGCVDAHFDVYNTSQPSPVGVFKNDDHGNIRLLTDKKDQFCNFVSAVSVEAFNALSSSTQQYLKQHEVRLRARSGHTSDAKWFRWSSDTALLIAAQHEGKACVFVSKLLSQANLRNDVPVAFADSRASGQGVGRSYFQES